MPGRLVFVGSASYGGQTIVDNEVVRGTQHGDAVRFAAGCATAHLDGASVRDLGDANPPEPLKLPARELKPIRAGARLEWADGTPAGELREPRSVEPAGWKPRGERFCQTRSNGEWYVASPGFEVCVSRSSMGPTEVDARSIMGGLGKDEIRAVMRTLISPRVQACYADYVKGHDAVVGRMMVRFTVGDSGRVVSAEITESGFDAPSMHKCILGVLKDTPFPTPGNGTVVVDYPFHFRTK